MLSRHIFFRHLLAALLSFAVLAGGGSTTNGAEPLVVTRVGAVETAFANNRELRIAELETDRAKATLRWAGRLDNPEFELNYSDDGVGLDENEGVLEVAFSQRFPITSRLKDEKRLRGFQVVLAEAEIAERRRELAGEVDLAVVELMATRAGGCPPAEIRGLEPGDRHFPGRADGTRTGLQARSHAGEADWPLNRTND